MYEEKQLYHQSTGMYTRTLQKYQYTYITYNVFSRYYKAMLIHFIYLFQKIKPLRSLDY